jgi:hypothetical protein
VNDHWSAIDCVRRPSATKAPNAAWCSPCRAGLGVGVGILLSVVPVAAQTRTLGLFQPAVIQDESDLTIHASIAGGYDKDSASSTFGNTTVTPPAGGASSGGRLDGQAGITFAKPGRRLSFGASGGSAFRSFQGFSSSLVWSHNASVGLAWSPRPRLSLQTNGYANYSPYQQFAVFPAGQQQQLGQTALPTLNYGTSAHDVWSYQSQTMVSYDLDQRSSVAFGYDLGYVDYEGSTFDLLRLSLNGRYRRGVTRNLALKAGYSYQHGNYQAVVPIGAVNLFRAHNIDVGVDYARSLSFSRRTTLSFGTGSIVLNDGVQTYFRILGDAALRHELSRNWDLTGTYIRRMNFVSGFTQPFFADSFGVDAAGLIGPQVDLVLSAGYSRGDVGLGTGASSYSSYHGTVRMQRSLMWNLALFGEYLYYHHRFARPIAVPLGTPDHLNRHGVRVGVAALIPLQGGGRTRASR